MRIVQRSSAPHRLRSMDKATTIPGKTKTFFTQWSNRAIARCPFSVGRTTNGRISVSLVFPTNYASEFGIGRKSQPIAFARAALGIENRTRDPRSPGGFRVHL